MKVCLVNRVVELVRSVFSNSSRKKMLPCSIPLMAVLLLLPFAAMAASVTPNNGPEVGGNTIAITNGPMGNSVDITNVTVCGVVATITDQCTNWVTIVAGAGPSGGATGDIVIQSTSVGDTTFINGYTYNPAGVIEGYIVNTLPALSTMNSTWLDGTNGIILAGATAEDQSGNCVNSVGDVNGDGLDDFLVGAFRADPSSRNVAGETYLIYGNTNGLPALITLNSTWLNGTNGIILAGAATNDQSGYWVAGAGDVNGDDLDDMLVGAIYADPSGRTNAGEAYLIYGQTNGLPAQITLNSTWMDGTNGVLLAGAMAGDYSGRSLSSAGDMNGDGLADFLIGAYGADPGGRSSAGETYLVYGQTNGLPALITLNSTWLDGTNGVLLAGDTAGDYSGVSVSLAGDMNGDGLDDFLVGAYAADPSGRSSAGETYLVYGQTNGLPALITLNSTWLDGTNGVLLAGAHAGDISGISVKSAGDIDGDGLSDMLIGAYTASPSGRSGAGESYLVYGRTNGLPAQITLDTNWLDGVNGVLFAGDTAEDNSGVSVSSAGDVNGDGLADFLIGAYAADPSGNSSAGETYLVYGQTNGLPALITLNSTWLDGTNGVLLAGNTALDRSGRSVSSAGDINSDGLDDLLIGARTADPSGRSDAGESYLVYGSADHFLPVSPTSGSWTGGYQVVINGENLGNGSDITNVTLCGTSVISIDSQSATQVVVTAGVAGAGGLGDVRVYSTSYGETVESDAFTYLAPVLSVLGTNGAAVSSSSAIQLENGTEFHPLLPGAAWTNTFSITNAGDVVLSISAYATNGADAASFEVSGVPANVAIGGVSNFTVVYSPAAIGGHAASVDFTCNEPNSPFVLNVGGSCYGLSTNIGPRVGGNSIIITNGTLGSGADITNVTVCGVQATITAQGENWVQITLGAGPSGGATGDIVIQSTSEGDTTLANAYTYNPAGRIGSGITAWTEIAALPAPRRSAVAAVYNDELFVIGGNQSGVTRDSVYSYDGATWSTETSLPVASEGAGAAVLGDYLYVMGGQYGGSTYRTNTYRYDGSTWTAMAGLPAGRSALSAVTYSGLIYAIGGRGSSGSATNVYAFDGTDWSEVAGLPEARTYAGAAVHEGAIYFVGGMHTGENVAKTNVYRFDGSSWSEMAALPDARDGLAVAALPGDLFAVGGEIAYVAQTNVFDLMDSSWSEWPGLPVVRRYLAGASLSNDVYVAGGLENNGTALANVYRGTGHDFGVSPSTGSWTGEYQVVISGSDLGNGSDITSVTICGTEVASIDSQSATQIVVTTGSGTPGINAVVVSSTSYGITTRSNAFEYLKESQTIDFPAIPAKTYGDAAFDPGATASSGLTVSYTTSDDAVATNAGSLIYITGVGSCDVVAMQSGNAYYHPAANITNDLVVTQKVLTVTGATGDNKVYDGNTDATITGGSLSGIVGADDVTLVNAATGTFASASVAVDIAVTSYMTLGGTAAGNYSLAQPTLDADITAKGLTVTGATGDNKVYDGNTDATITGGSLSGIVGADDVTLVNAATGTFASASVAVDIAVTSYMTLGGTAAGNYSLAQPTLDADITQAGQTITFPPISDQVVSNLVELAATADSGLSVSFAVGSGPATINGDTNLSFTSHGEVSIVASQTGDVNYAAAPNVTNSFRVYGLFTVTVHSVYGVATPSTGEHVYVEDSIVTNTVTSPDEAGTTQFVCSGWTSSANDPLAGGGTLCVMTVTNTTDLTWLWTTNYWLDTEVGPHGSVNVADGWQAFGSTTQITANADLYYHFTNWTGDASGSLNPLDLLINAPKSVTANFAENVTANTDTPEWWLASFGLTNFQADAADDGDGDGIPTWQEYIADTIPTNIASLLALEKIGMGSIHVEWIGGTGVIQYLEWSTNASDGSTWSVVATNTPPTPITNQVDVSEDDTSGFYRIRAVR